MTDTKLAERIEAALIRARIRLGTFILGNHSPRGHRGVFIGEAGAIIEWPEGVSGAHIFGADVGLDLTGGTPRTIFKARAQEAHNG